jgi:predicted AlkP superfamily phosphohydrolase/phosphomutase
VSRRALVLGLDGMPLDLLRRLAADGVMPAVAELLAGGTAVELEAPVPEISSTSWASFLTGANPGRHGVYGFVELVPGSYEPYFPNVTALRAPPLWDHVAAAGLSTLCLNVPGTYPAPAIRGAVVSGFVAPSLERAVSPARLLEPLRRRGYPLDVEVGDPAADPAGFLARVRAATTARAAAFEHLLDTEPWDVAVAVLTETDRLQHFLWRPVTDPRSPLHQPVLDVYALVDVAVGRLARRARDTDELVLLSDHGFGPADCQFHVNAWLREAGYLAPADRTPAPAALAEDTAVFALDPARLYLHRAGRFPRGGLDPAGAGALADEVAERLLALRWRDGELGPDVPGRPVVDRVYRRDEVYAGPLVELAPDLVAMPAHGVQLRGSFRPGPALAGDVFTGTHTRGNAVFYLRGDPAGVALDGPVAMQDAVPLVLGRLGVPTGAALAPIGGSR